MKSRIALFTLALFLLNAPLFGQFDTLKLKGVYTGKNLHVKNPYNENGVGYCISEVFVNTQRLTDQCWRQLPFEIDFPCCGLKQGDSVRIQMVVQKGCNPKVLNPEVLKPRNTCEYLSVEVHKDSITWVTKNEQGSLPFIVEHYRWNKWVHAGEVKGKGTSGENRYALKINLHSGENKFRVRQVRTTMDVYSNVVTATSKVPSVTLKQQEVDDMLYFSGTTRFEIYSELGDILKKGVADKVNCSDLKRGYYYVNFDNAQEKIFKK
jgi:hypothetical protein